MLTYNYLPLLNGIMEHILFADKKRNPRRVIQKRIPETQVKILDMCAGCASGAICIAENNPNSSITAIDISEAMLYRAEKKCKKKRIDNLTFMKKDASDTGLQDGSIDIILLSLVLHELNDRQAGRILMEVKRLLKGDGILYVTEWRRPVHIFHRVVFCGIKCLESKQFEEFLRIDKEKYFLQHSFQISKIIQCSYTNVFKLVKISK